MTTQYHKRISYIKSGLRILGSLISLIIPITHSIYILSSFLLLAEILGIVEELKE